MDNELHFPMQLQLRLDWSDMDLFGHVNNVAYFRFIQSSRVNYWEASMLTALFTKMKMGPILLSTGCQFIKPLHYPGTITIEVRVEFVKNTSFGLHHRILNEHNEVAAEAHDVIVMYDFEKEEKIQIPDDFRNYVAANS